MLLGGIMKFVLSLLAGFVSYLVVIHAPWIVTVPVLAFIIVLCFLVWLSPAKNVERIWVAADSGTTTDTWDAPLLTIAGTFIGACIGLYVRYPSLRDTLTSLLTP